MPLYMIFIQRVVCFLSPGLGEGISNTQRLWSILYTIANHEILFIACFTKYCVNLNFFSVKIVIVRRRTYHLKDVNNFKHGKNFLEVEQTNILFSNIFMNSWNINETTSNGSLYNTTLFNWIIYFFMLRQSTS